MKVTVRQSTINDNNFIQYTIKRVLSIDNADLSDCLILVACDTYAKDVVIYGYVILNADNDIVFCYVKPVFRQLRVFTKLLNKIPVRPRYYLNFVNYKSDKIMKHINIQHKRKLMT